MELQRLDHVSINVTDRGRAVAWYREVLGLEQKGEPKQHDWPVFMGDFGSCIALFQAQVVSPERAAESSGLRHVAFLVDDVEAWRTRLEEHGADFRFEDHGNAHSLYVRDPDGNVVELTKYL
jgi:catechol 2,3-dioxygenase-like lactoylglutathione lyase family enzyme